MQAGHGSLAGGHGSLTALGGGRHAGWIVSGGGGMLIAQDSLVAARISSRDPE